MREKQKKGKKIWEKDLSSIFLLLLLLLVVDQGHGAGQGVEGRLGVGEQHLYSKICL